MENEWLLRNPSKRMKGVKVSRVPTGYFAPQEFHKILDATYAYAEWKVSSSQSLPFLSRRRGGLRGSQRKTDTDVVAQLAGSALQGGCLEIVRKTQFGHIRCANEPKVQMRRNRFFRYIQNRMSQ